MTCCISSASVQIFVQRILGNERGQGGIRCRDSGCVIQKKSESEGDGTEQIRAWGRMHFALRTSISRTLRITFFFQYLMVPTSHLIVVRTSLLILLSS